MQQQLEKMHILKFTDTLARSFFLFFSFFPQTQLLKKLSFLNIRFFLTLTLYLFLTPKLPLNVKATSAGNELCWKTYISAAAAAVSLLITFLLTMSFHALLTFTCD